MQLHLISGQTSAVYPQRELGGAAVALQKHHWETPGVRAEYKRNTSEAQAAASQASGLHLALTSLSAPPQQLEPSGIPLQRL